MSESNKKLSRWVMIGFVLSLMPGYILAQPDTLWTKIFGGSGVDKAYSIEETIDSGYIMVGKTASYGAGGNDLWFLKTDKNGNKLWDKVLGGESDDCGYWIQETSDGNCILTGYTDSYGAGGQDLWLIKIDKDGKELWAKTFGGPQDEGGMSLHETSDGGYIITGYTNSYGAGGQDVWLLKTDKDGNKLWEKTFGENWDDVGYSVDGTSDTGYIVVAFTRSHGAGGSDVWLLKTDKDGNKLWDRTFGGFLNEVGAEVQETSNGGYIIAGTTPSYGEGKGDVWLIRTDRYGNKLWDETFGGQNTDQAYSLVQTKDGAYLINGWTYSFGGGDADVWLIKVDKDGYKLWEKTIGGSGLDRGYGTHETTDGSYILCGETDSYGAGMADVWLIKVAANSVGK